MTTTLINEEATSGKSLSDLFETQKKNPSTILADSDKVRTSFDLDDIFISQLLIEELEELKELEDDWNSYGAKPINKEIINKAKKLISRIDFKQFPIPCICPVANGGLDIEWDTQEKHLSFKLRDNENRYFFADRLSDKNEGDKVQDIQGFLPILRYLIDG